MSNTKPEPTRVVMLDARVSTKADVMDRFALRLGFPPWFGRNWDALADSLAEAAAKRHIIVEFEDCDLDRDTMRTLMTILEDVHIEVSGQ